MEEVFTPEQVAEKISSAKANNKKCFFILNSYVFDSSEYGYAMLQAMAKNLKPYLYTITESALVTSIENITEPERTKAEISDLVARWKGDSIWDLEMTEGFEAHYGELLKIRKEQEQYWQWEHDRHITNKAVDCLCSIETAIVIDHLEREIELLKTEIERIKYAVRN